MLIPMKTYIVINLQALEAGQDQTLSPLAAAKLCPVISLKEVISSTTLNSLHVSLISTPGFKNYNK
jgi:hypothetical protein